jgi:hypothetical protein
MKSMVERGSIRFGQLKEYRDSEQNQVGDPSEGAFSVNPFGEGKVQLLDEASGEYKDVGTITNGVAREFWNNNLSKRVFSICYHVIMSKSVTQLSELIDPNLMTKFGYDSFVIIPNVNAFLERVDKVLTLRNLYYSGRKVNYIGMDKKRTELTPFDKDVKYIDQNEFRLVIDNPDAPEFIELGSLEGIAHLFAKEDVSELSIHVQNT